LLEAEYYQITSLVKQLKCETSTNTIVVEKLLFDPDSHHPQVIISEAGLKADHPGDCVQYLYAKVHNTLWQNGRHYWEIIMDTANSNVPIIFFKKYSMLIILKIVIHQWVSLHPHGIQTNA
jgi:hypothetical protein